MALSPRHALTRCKAKTRRCALRCFGGRRKRSPTERGGTVCGVRCALFLALQKQRATEAKLTRAKLELDEKSAACAKLEAELAALQATGECNSVTTV